MGIGGSFGGSSSSSSSTSTTNSWLLEYLKPMIQGAISGAGNMPEYGYAGLNQSQIDALQGIMGGRDQSGLQQGAGQLGNLGGGLIHQGGLALQESMNQYKELMGSLTNGGYQDKIDQYYNSDLVNQQTSQLQSTLQGQLDQTVQGINQAAGGSGGMGSSRAGVAEGVAVGKTQEALAQGTTALQQQAWQNAIGAAGQDINAQMSGIQSGIQQGNQLLGQGTGLLNSSMQWGSQLQSNAMQDLFNKYGAGSIIQENLQGQMDTDRLNQIIKDNPMLGQLQLLLPIIGGTAGWGSTTTGSGSSSSKEWGVSGGIGNWSDKRLKDDIEVLQEGEVHKLESGDVYYIPRIYRWKWNDKAVALFKEQGTEVPANVGVLAQELEVFGLSDLVKKHKTEVEGLDGEVRSVDYARLSLFIRAVYQKLGEEA